MVPMGRIPAMYIIGRDVTRRSARYAAPTGDGGDAECDVSVVAGHTVQIVLPSMKAETLERL